MLVQMLRVFAHGLLPGPLTTTKSIIGDVLGIFAQSDPAGVRTDRLAEFGREQQHREHFIQASEPAGVRLYDVDGIAGHELFEYDAILSVLTRGDPDGAHGARDLRMAENVIGADGLLDPPGIESGQRA